MRQQNPHIDELHARDAPLHIKKQRMQAQLVFRKHVVNMRQQAAASRLRAEALPARP